MADIHPGRALYRKWRKALRDELTEQEFRTGVGMHYGRDRDMGIAHYPRDENGPARIVYGHCYGQYVGWQIYGGFTLRADGGFRLPPLHGFQQRNVLARNTFLRWSWFIGSYHWTVDDSRSNGGWDDSNRELAEDYGHRQPYITERIIGQNGWANPSPWVALRPDGNGFWDLRPHADALREKPYLRERWAWHDALREKRLTRAYRVANGLVQPSRPNLTADEKQERHEQRIEHGSTVIAAHLSLDMPANTRRKVVRPKETAWPAPAGTA